MAKPLDLSDDEKQLIVNILTQLNYTLPDSRKVNPIVDKLIGSIEAPKLKVEEGQLVDASPKESAVTEEPSLTN